MRRDIRQRVVRQGDVEVIVKEAEIDEGSRTRFMAELSLAGRDERAVVDAVSREDYPAILAAALTGFAASVRLRRLH